MNWLKENPALSTLIGVTVVLCAGIGYFLFSNFGSYTEAIASYEAAVRRLHQLQNQTPFPNDANLKAVTAEKDKFEAALSGLKEKLSTTQTAPDPSITPQQFQDELRATQKAFAEKAAQARVSLPEGFFLGFDSYEASPPSADAAPELERQLRFIATILNDLVGNNAENPGIRAITALNRPRLPIEDRAGPNEKPAPGTPEFFPFSVSITVEQGKFRIALNSLLDSPEFLMIRALSIRNSSMEGPLVQDTPSTVESSNDLTTLFGGEGSGGGEESGGSDLNVVLGREVLEVSLRLEMVDLNLEAETGTETKNGKK